MYASTRMLYTGVRRQAPRIFSAVERRRTAQCAVCDYCDCGAVLPDLDVRQPDGLPVAAEYLGMTGFIAWLGITISHYRFRRGYVLQGNDINNLPYRSGFFPLGLIFAFVLCLIILPEL